MKNVAKIDKSERARRLTTHMLFFVGLVAFVTLAQGFAFLSSSARPSQLRARINIPEKYFHKKCNYFGLISKAEFFKVCKKQHFLFSKKFFIDEKTV